MTNKFSTVYPYTKRESLMEGKFPKRLSLSMLLQQRLGLGPTSAFFLSFIVQTLCTVGLLTLVLFLTLFIAKLPFSVITSRTVAPSTFTGQFARVVLFMDISSALSLSVFLLLTIIHFLLETVHVASNDQLVTFYARIKPYFASTIRWTLTLFTFKIVFEASLLGAQRLITGVGAVAAGTSAQTHVTSTIEKIMTYFKTITAYDVLVMVLTAWTLSRWLVLLQKALLFHISYGFNKSSTKDRVEKIRDIFKVVEQLRQAYGSQRALLADFKYDHVAYYEALMKNADELGEQIFASIRSAAEAHDAEALVKEHFQGILSQQAIEILFATMDMDGSGRISLIELQRGIYFVYQEQVNIERTLRDNEDIIGKLDELMILLTRCLMVFSTCIAFHFDLFWSSVAGVGSATLGFFTIKDIAQDISKSIIFLFAYHPFDINDRVIIDGNTFTVKKIGFLMTTVRGPQSATVYLKNSALCDKTIRNLRRSGDQSESLTLALDAGTTQEMLGRLEDEMNAFLMANSRDFYPKCSVSPLVVNNSKKLTYSFYYSHRANFQNDSLRSQRCKRFNFALYDAINRLGIKIAQPD